MLFQDRRLRSVFDLDQKDFPTQISLSLLAEEIQRISQALYSLYVQKEVVTISIWEKTIYLDFTLIDEAVWFRSMQEIKQLLYRNRNDDGKYPDQFSLNKFFSQIGLKEPKNAKTDFEYLQLLYLFYMVHYFIFPKEQIFRKWKEHHYDFEWGYDEGASEALKMQLIISQLLSAPSQLENYISYHSDIDRMLEIISQRINGEDVEDILFSIKDASESLTTELLFLCDQYNFCSYCHDLICSLSSLSLEDLVPAFLIPPFPSWKHQYVSINELDAFLKSNALYWFCHQRMDAVSSRTKLKFIQSNAVKSFNQIIENDKKWLKDSDEGLILQRTDKGDVVYALRAAIIIKTYIDLINDKKFRLFIGNNKVPFGTQLIHPSRSIYHTLSERFFILMCHIEYGLSIHGSAFYEDAYDLIRREILFLSIAFQAYQEPSFKDCENFLKNFLRVF